MIELLVCVDMAILTNDVLNYAIMSSTVSIERVTVECLVVSRRMHWLLNYEVHLGQERSLSVSACLILDVKTLLMVLRKLGNVNVVVVVMLNMVLFVVLLVVGGVMILVVPMML